MWTPARALALLAALLAAAASADPDAPDEEAPPPDAPAIPAPPPDPEAELRARAAGADLADAKSYLRANVQDANGAWAYVHFTPAEMPLRIAIGKPKDPPRLCSSADGREAALDGVRVWVRALRAALPWFAVEFVEKDPSPDVMIVWKRRVTGSAAGRGGLGYRIEDGRVVVSGQLELSTRPDPHGPKLTCEEITRVVAHEFGHVLGLSHCLDCDSVMNYSWQTRERMLITPADVKTYLELLKQPNGVRYEGGPLAGLGRTGWGLGQER